MQMEAQREGDEMPNQKRQYTMSEDARKQRIKFGFKRNLEYSGQWTMIRIRPEQRDALKKKYGSLKAAFDFAEHAR